MRGELACDHLVVGAGAAGMAFVDALVDHSDAEVVIVDRRHAPGGHWLDAYPFVRLHQASVFYGVASTRFGEGAAQRSGPEVGLHERATAAEVCAYYDRAMDRLLETGRVHFLAGHEYEGDGVVRSRVSGRTYDVRVRRSVVDAHYLEPDIPATSPPPFAVDEDAAAVPVNDLVEVDGAPRSFVIVGSGKTATDACVWLLGQGVDPDAICWVRPRDPWMLNRAVVQPDPAVFLGMAADTFQAAAESADVDDMFLRLEESGVMIRIDPTVRPTMARAPTLATCELDHLRSIENVVRRGHVRRVRSDRLVMDDGEVSVPRDSLVVHCASAGLRGAPPVPIWGDGTITLQPIRAGFPCFGAALAGYVEATRATVEEKNRLCPSSPYGNTPAGWARMQALGTRAAAAFGAEPDIAAWARECWLNPARVPSGRRDDPAVTAAQERIRRFTPAALERLDRYAALA
ncbi:NAD(P)-binding protein [Nocardioides panacisoli]|uniref:NAD(P)-binding protein n=1 Tax=Nocardioides panacisoli TaxID=627624 RepID=UPI001C6252D8|nr:NAD(P)-binding protein [Nocardioides panacisoli]QYJ05582.1 NAD(P)-binding protein [Nocardioides panacisoli]